jgi:hypothetical protein
VRASARVRVLTYGSSCGASWCVMPGQAAGPRKRQSHHPDLLFQRALTEARCKAPTSLPRLNEEVLVPLRRSYGVRIRLFTDECVTKERDTAWPTMWHQDQSKPHNLAMHQP